MFLSAVLSLSLTPCSIARPRSEEGRALYVGHISKLYVRVGVQSRLQKLGIEARLGFLGIKDREATFLKVRVLKGLAYDPAFDGPFAGHINSNPGLPRGNCTKAFLHHNPLNATEGLIRNPAFPQYYQTGDLSGRHGKLQDLAIAMHTFGVSQRHTPFLGAQLTADAFFMPTRKGSKYIKGYPTSAPVQPTPPVVPFDETAMTDPAIIATLP
ncbi:hypothetical protein OPQ81_006010 [Rhizoctonia solani]|nr:hypothetical protein OPQ81_006010 [Rhizoctonia solani]